MKTQHSIRQPADKTQNVANFLFEASTLKRLKRTGWQILGENEESIAEHSYMVAVISYSLSGMMKIDRQKVLLMALFHDFSETRTGDIYKLADKYVSANVFQASKDSFEHAPNGNELYKLIEEYEKEQTLESKIVHDADTLAICLELKQLMEKGNKNASEWFSANKKALRLDVSKRLFEEIEKTSSHNWWKKEREEIHQGFTK